MCVVKGKTWSFLSCFKTKTVGTAENRERYRSLPNNNFWLTVTYFDLLKQNKQNNKQNKKFILEELNSKIMLQSTTGF